MFKRIMVSLDLSDQSDHGAALTVAKNYAKNGGKIFVIHVLPLIKGGGIIHSYLPENISETLIAESQKKLLALTQEHLPGHDGVAHLTRQGKIYEKVIETAEQLSIDLIITAAISQKQGKSSQFGPNIARIARYADCSVLVLR